MVEEKKEVSLFEVFDRDLIRRVCEYMDVSSLCRTDTATAGKRSVREAWLLAIKGIASPAMSKYQKHSNVDGFVALRWCAKKCIMLRQIRLWKIVDKSFFCPPCAHAIIPEDAHFQWLCSNNYAEIARTLVTSRSIDVNKVSSNSHYYCEINESLDTLTPILHVAVEFGHAKLSKFLIYNGANMLAESPGGFTCLHAGVRSRNDKNPKNIEAVKSLFEYPEADALKDKPSVDGVTPLLQAVRLGSTKMVAALLERVDPNKCAPSDGLYPIMHCTSDEIRALLVAAGAKDDHNFKIDNVESENQKNDTVT